MRRVPIAVLVLVLLAGLPALAPAQAPAETHPLTVRDMLAIVKNKDRGQIDYAWRNAVTGKVDKKHSYLRKVGNVVVGVGYYAN